MKSRQNLPHSAALARLVRAFARDASGATAVEYTLVTGIMAMAIVAAWPALSAGIEALWTAIGNAMLTVPQ